MGHSPTTGKHSSVGSLLLEYWRKRKSTWFRSGPKLRPGASEAELSRFEAKYGVRLPEDMRGYLALVDGMEESTGEGELVFSFWQLGRIRPIPEESATTSFVGEEHYLKVPKAESYFCFADYLIESEVYCIFLSADATARNPVIGYDGSPKADSFTDFAMKYMQDPGQLT